MAKPAKILRPGRREDITYYDTRREAQILLGCNSEYLDNLVAIGIVRKTTVEMVELFNAADLRTHMLDMMYEHAEINGMLNADGSLK